ncbi:hypothetical protein [Agaribacterium haliotis]|uniref:hypothetical protein n=1 Tax=Agaribacterium haliotis TaxID=2013869 RepID=UPI000BB545F4|nr:hypothetical protein [Agaribacterium haliotis]
MKHLIDTLLPPRPRNFKGKRWLQISLRSLHLVGVAGFSGGILFGVDKSSWIGFLHLCISTGIAYFLLDIYCNAMNLIQLRGAVIFIKLALLGTLYYHPEQANIVLVVILLASLISHAPGDVRYFSLLHGKRMDVRSGAAVCGSAAKQLSRDAKR